MLNVEQKQAIKRSWELVVPIAETAADLFYKRLFELAPDYRTMFPDDMTPQKRKLMAMLQFIVKSIDWPDDAWRDTADAEQDMFLIVLALGRRHIDLYQVPDEAYEAVEGALMWTLDYGLGEAFTTETRDAWAQIYRLLAKTMKMGRLAPGKGSAKALRANDA